MIDRPFWILKIENAWKKRSIVWLSGVRRVGKTVISKMLPNANYFNCDLPSVMHRLEDPELFYQSFPNDSIIIFDEIHRINDPSKLLKIAADEFPQIKILATGSSSLTATKKFRDSLTGRKINIYLPPVLWNECQNNFKINNLDHRLLNGGLPELLLSKEKDSSFFAEWIDSYYARDIQELFNIRNRGGFLKLLKLLLIQSGNVLDYTYLSKLCGQSRPTVITHVEAMRIAHCIFIVTPFFGGGSREIIRQPKIYAFDTGFITYSKGWNSIREDDRGILWEHLILDMLRTNILENEIHYWRDKSGCEIDFIIVKDNNSVDTIECKINPKKYSIKNLSVFRKIYPFGRNFCLCPLINENYQLRYDNLIIEFQSCYQVQQ
ncbi:MAG: ATP-binding protein [Bacteroidales bacterium]|nr:ATP-binding protein [Bacteroidales bacterium]